MSARPPRGSCYSHGRYTPGCDDCKVFRRAYDCWHRPPMVPDGLWALRLFGDFEEQSGVTYTIQVLDEATAYRRAAWWREYRADVRARALTRESPSRRWYTRGWAGPGEGWICPGCRREPWLGGQPGGVECGCEDVIGEISA